MTEQTEAPARPLYDRLRQIQLANGWTNVQLAEKAGIARGTIENWKTQPRSPMPATVKDVAERLDIPYSEALELAGIAARGVHQGRRLRERIAQLDEKPEQPQPDEGGTFRLTVIVNAEDPEPDLPPGGLRDQVERIIWAIDEPWPIRWAQIQARRAILSPPQQDTEEQRRTGNGQ